MTIACWCPKACPVHDVRPEEMAREIAEIVVRWSIEQIDENEMTKQIAAHLRAYGEEEFKRGYEMWLMADAHSSEHIGRVKHLELLKKAEADGFRRGARPGRGEVNYEAIERAAVIGFSATWASMLDRQMIPCPAEEFHIGQQLYCEAMFEPTQDGGKD